MWPTFGILRPPNISGMAKARNFKFGTKIPTFGISGPPNISWTVKARNFKFGKEMDGTEYERKKNQNWVKGVTWGSRGPLLEFCDRIISLERLKLENSNLAQKWMAVSANEKMQNCVKRGHEESTWPTFGILGPPNIAGINKARNFKFGSEIDGSEH